MRERRVVHVVRSDGFAGVERYVCDTATELAHRGWEVTVVGGDPWMMRRALPETVAFTPARTSGEVARAIWQAGPVPVLHTHMTAAEAAAVALKGIRFRRWVTTRHFARPRGTSPLGRAASPLIRNRVDVQIAISHFVADAIDGDSVVLHNGVPASTQGEAPRERTVVMMQRLEAEKDAATGVRAWARSGLAERGWTLHLFGRGSQRTSLEDEARGLGVAHSTVFEGFAEEPRQVLARAGVLLATAPAEPFGLSVVEAMAEGTPVIAADGGAHRETLGELGELFAPGDDQQAAALLRRLADDADRRTELGRALQRRHAEAFALTTHVDRLEQVYEQERP